MAINLKSWLAGLLLKGYTETWVPDWVQHNFIAPTFQHLAAEGHKANAIVFSCVSTLVDGFVEAPLRVYDRDGDLLTPVRDTDALPRLLNNPNDQMSQAELMEYVMLYAAIGGNCYLQKLRSRSGLVGELVPYSDADLTPVKWRGPFVDHYEYRDPKGIKREVPLEDVIHLKWAPDPLRPWTGMSPLVAVAREVDTDSEAARYIYTMLKNDAVPRFVLTRPAGTPPLSDPEFRRFQEMWQQRYGSGKRGMPALLEAGTTIHELSMSLDKLALDALRGVPETRVCAVYRTHPVLIGLNTGLQASTYNNYEEVRLAFTEHTLYPLWRRFADEIRQGLRDDFRLQPNRVLSYDTTKIAALAAREKERREGIRALVESQIMRIDEARSALGLPKIEGTDRFLERGNTALPAPEKRYYIMPPTKALLSYGITDEDVDEAIERWDEAMPNYAGLLEARVENDEEGDA